MRSSIGIDVRAPAELVFELARDVERWPDLLPHYQSARRLAAPDADGRLLVRFVARRPLIGVLGVGAPVVWHAWTWAEPATRRLRFRHRGGATAGMDVTWRIEGNEAGGCRVDIDHAFAPPVPGWAWFIDRQFTRPIASRTLASFRTIAEAVAGADQSEARSVANPLP